MNHKIQDPVYFISKVMSDSKIAYAFLITSCKLSHYFHAHQIKVHTSSTLKEIQNNGEATEKIAKWVIELSLYNIISKPRTVIKTQALSDFMAEWTETQSPALEHELEYWIFNFDGSLQL
jgi:peptidase E